MIFKGKKTDKQLFDYKKLIFLDFVLFRVVAEWKGYTIFGLWITKTSRRQDEDAWSAGSRSDMGVRTRNSAAMPARTAITTIR